MKTYIAADADWNVFPEIVMPIMIIALVFHFYTMFKEDVPVGLRGWCGTLLMAGFYVSLPGFVSFGITADALRCSGVLAAKVKYEVAQGEVKIIPTPRIHKSIQFSVGDATFTSWKKGATGECGWLKSVGQSMEIRDGMKARVRAVDGAVVFFEPIP